MTTQADEVKVTLAAAFGPILKEAFPAEHPVTRFQVAHALADAAWKITGATREGEPVRRVEELPMVAFAERSPIRDEWNGEQTILTYSENVGVYDLEFFESGDDFPERWLGSSHWLDITGMWPGVTAQVTEFMAQPQAGGEEVQQLVTEAEFVARLSDALVKAYRRAGGIARVARSARGAAIIRNIATLEAAAIYRAAIAAMPSQSTDEVGS